MRQAPIEAVERMNDHNIKIALCGSFEQRLQGGSIAVGARKADIAEHCNKSPAPRLDEVGNEITLGVETVPVLSPRARGSTKGRSWNPEKAYNGYTENGTGKISLQVTTQESTQEAKRLKGI